MLATYQHMQGKYGFVPDSWEVILGPDTGNAGWSATQVAQAIKAAGDRLAANGFTPNFTTPSTTDGREPRSTSTRSRRRREQCSMSGNFHITAIPVFPCRISKALLTGPSRYKQAAMLNGSEPIILRFMRLKNRTELLRGSSSLGRSRVLGSGHGRAPIMLSTIRMSRRRRSLWDRGQSTSDSTSSLYGSCTSGSTQRRVTLILIHPVYRPPENIRGHEVDRGYFRSIFRGFRPGRTASSTQSRPMTLTCRMLRSRPGN